MRRMREQHGRIKKMQCPICKVQGPFQRNRSLEKQLLKLSEPCRHAKCGCPKRFFPWDDHRELHENYLCIHQPADCPFCHQSIPGGRANLIEHIVKSMGTTPSLTSTTTSSQCTHSSPDPQEEVEMEMMELMEEMEEHERDSALPEMNGMNGINEFRFTEISSEPIPPLQLDQFMNHQRTQNESSVSPMLGENEANIDTDIIIDEEKENEEAHSSSGSEPSPGMQAKMGVNDSIPRCSLLWAEGGIDQNSPEDRYILNRDQNQFIPDFEQGIVFCFLHPTEECLCWRVYALSMSPRHGSCGNSKVYIQYCSHDEREQFMKRQDTAGLQTPYLTPPPETTLILEMGRLHPSALRQRFNSYPPQHVMSEITKKPGIKSRETMSLNNSEMKENEEDRIDLIPSMKMEMDTDSNDQSQDGMSLELEEYAPSPFVGQSPCTQIQFGLIFGGNPKYGPQETISSLNVRIFSVEQALQVGAVIDARDHNGNWCLAEIKMARDEEGNEFVTLHGDDEHTDYLEIRQAKIHWLGYPSIYDEWIDVDTDSHRIAQRGTFTVGPDLRAMRKHDIVLRAMANRNSGDREHRDNRERAVPQLTR